MATKIGFDAKRCLNAQIDKILDRVTLFDKLYLEFSGKLRGCEIHTTHLMNEGIEKTLKQAELNLTIDAKLPFPEMILSCHQSEEGRSR